MVSTIQQAQFTLKKGDTSPAIVCTLEGADEANDPLNLAGSAILFIMRPQATGSTVKVNAAATIVNNTLPAKVSYSWIAGDTDTSGLFVAEWEVTFASGKKETFPNSRFIGILIRDDLAD